MVNKTFFKVYHNWTLPITIPCNRMAIRQNSTKEKQGRQVHINQPNCSVNTKYRDGVKTRQNCTCNEISILVTILLLSEWNMNITYSKAANIGEGCYSYANGSFFISFSKNFTFAFIGMFGAKSVIRPQHDKGIVYANTQ